MWFLCWTNLESGKKGGKLLEFSLHLMELSTVCDARKTWHFKCNDDVFNCRYNRIRAFDHRNGFYTPNDKKTTPNSFVGLIFISMMSCNALSTRLTNVIVARNPHSNIVIMGHLKTSIIIASSHQSRKCYIAQLLAFLLFSFNTNRCHSSFSSDHRFCWSTCSLS